MKTEHLTDETLQAFLLNELQDDAIVRHLAVCPICTENLGKYQQLVTIISKISPETFSFDVSAVVLTKIVEVETQKERNTNRVLYLGLSMVSLVALFLAYPYLQLIFSQFQSHSGISNAFMLVSGLGVIIFLIKDIFRQYKHKEMLLMQ